MAKSKYSLKQSFQFAFKGIATAWKQSRNLKIHFCAAVLVILAGMFFHINKQEWITCLILFGLVISAEMFNSAIEITLDRITHDNDQEVKHAKDIAAGAVLVTAIIAAIIGLIIFVPYILEFGK